MIYISCLSPLIAYPNKLSANGKMTYIPVRRYTGDYDWTEYVNENFGEDVYKPVLVPCGKCIGCRLDYSREWAARCMLEMKDHDSAYFITLTYSDAAVPKVWFDDPEHPESGNRLPALSLRSRDLQLWLKRVRKEYCNDKIRFFACGEYGSKTLRPHYHVILFGIHLDDLVVYKRSETGLLYNSDRLSRTWYSLDPDTHLHWPLGHVVIAECTFDTCAYVARYTAKKTMTMESDFFERFNMEAPFIRMSRRPGIGAGAIERGELGNYNKSLYFGTDKGAKKTSIPKYYLRKLESSDPDLAERIRELRKNNGYIAQKSKIEYRGRSYEDLLKDAEITILEKAKALQREI